MPEDPLSDPKMEFLKSVFLEFDRRLATLADAVTVLGQIVKLQGARLENLEDKFDSHKHVPDP